MGDFNWKTWAVKGLKKSAVVGVFAFGTAFVDYIKLTDFPVEYVGYVGGAIVIIELVLNGIKHKWLVE